MLRIATVEEPIETPGSIRLAVTSAGVNFADTMISRDQYVRPTELPYVPGTEVVGTDSTGRRMVGLTTTGGYAEFALVDASRSAAVPDGVTDAQALALVNQGLTAWHLVHTSARVLTGESVLVHAAAGGVGSIAVQLAHIAGAFVIASVSSDEKAVAAKDLGADATIDSALPKDELAAAILAANNGRPVDVVLDGTGGDAFSASLESLAPFGRLVHFGVSGGQMAPLVDPWSLTVGSRGVMGFYNRDAFELPGGFRSPLATMFEQTLSGTLRHLDSAPYALEDAGVAHADLLGRRTSGKVVIAVAP
ncbi:quinone oxidoreductase family protein [Conyzicola nivalis]|uniref:quinone oxidoreductase family protein n=1 Tax=Conyzicola nivalis TaxID=1477021 RepID=UPI001E2D8FB9|nr:zinc-binding dehydrogenase [Conyzicola nivalis]